MKKKILLAGESWTSHTIHIKGFDSFFTSFYEEGAGQLTAALAAGGYQVDYLPNHQASLRFPFCLEELRDYSCVIFSDIGSNTLLLHPDTFVRGKILPNRCNALLEYVEDGGAFLMIGGYMSFSGVDAKAKWGRTALKNLLSVRCLEGDDLVERPEGVVPEALCEHPALRGVPLQWPRFLGYNKTLPIPEGQIVLSCDGDPFLAFREVGKGKTGAFMSDCAPHWGSPEFLEWEGYGPLWTGIVDYLTE